MLWIAAISEGIVRNYAGMGILLGIQFVTTLISFYESSKASDAMDELKASLKPLATVKRDGMWKNIDASMVVPGDLVKLAAGSAVPADCYVNEGEIEVDQCALTGESLPVKFRYGDVCKMGSVVTRGNTYGTVETTGKCTFFGKTTAMHVENVGDNLPTLLSGVTRAMAFLPLSLCTISFIFSVVGGIKQNNSVPLQLMKDQAAIVKVSATLP
jgi:H+-transporting ATPase